MTEPFTARQMRAVLRSPYGDVQTEKNAAEIMATLLGHMKALYWFHWTAHWQTAGSYGDHLLFERMKDAVEGEIDSLAEKIVGYYGAHVVEPWHVLQHEHQGMAPEGSGEDLLGTALSMERGFQQFLSAVYDMLGNLEMLPIGLDDYLQAVANTHDAHVFLLQQRLGGLVGPSPDRVAKEDKILVLNEKGTKVRVKRETLRGPGGKKYRPVKPEGDKPKPEGDKKPGGLKKIWKKLKGEPKEETPEKKKKRKQKEEKTEAKAEWKERSKKVRGDPKYEDTYGEYTSRARKEKGRQAPVMSQKQWDGEFAPKSKSYHSHNKARTAARNDEAKRTRRAYLNSLEKGWQGQSTFRPMRHAEGDDLDEGWEEWGDAGFMEDM